MVRKLLHVLAIESLGETRLASRVFEMKEKYGLNFLTRAIKQNVDDKKPFIGYRLCPESKQRMLDILAGKAYSTAKIGAKEDDNPLQGELPF